MDCSSLLSELSIWSKTLISSVVEIASGSRSSPLGNIDQFISPQKLGSTVEAMNMMFHRWIVLLASGHSGGLQVASIFRCASRRAVSISDRLPCASTASRFSSNAARLVSLTSANSREICASVIGLKDIPSFPPQDSVHVHAAVPSQSVPR